MREYLKDSKFLSMLDEMRIKKHYAKLTILTFVDEKPLREVQGIATAGSVTVNGEASLRRTISLTISSIEDENDITNIKNIISMNKKVKVEIGLENLFEEYMDYGKIIWFPIGTYVINQATTSTSASSANISISGKDKMCMLDGTCGGTLPSSVTFHENQYEDENGDIRSEDVPIFTIIKECVTHFGKEPEQNVIINDVDMTAKLSTKYIGQDPIWFSKDYQSFIISKEAPEDEKFLQHKFVYGQDVGYQETDLTYPGELVFSAGDTVTAVLDKIIEALGNYEYFYDLDGHFVFQQKKNYLNYYYTPIMQLNDNYYIKAFSDSKYYYTFINAKDALSYYNSPKYENIKNDFIVWGDKTNSEGITKTIQYHLAIDEKPIIDLANQYMWDIQNGKGEHCYYLFEYERSDYDNMPEPKPIEINYENNSSEIKDNAIEIDIKNYINQNLLQNYSFNTSDYFIIYFKISFLNEIRYYQVKIQNKAIIEYKYLEDLTDKIDFTHLAFGIYPKKDKEDVSDDDNSSDDKPIDHPDKPNVPDLNPDSGIPDSWHRDKQNQLDPDFSANSDGSFNSSNDKEEKKEEIKGYYLGITKKVENKIEFGYYNKNKEWTKIYEINEDLSLINLENFINKIKNNYYLKILQDKNFQENNKDYDFSLIELINTTSSMNTNIANYKLIEYFEDGTFKEYSYILPKDYQEIRNKDDKVLLSQEQHNQLIASLLQYYKDNQNDLITDLALIFDYEDEESAKDENTDSSLGIPDSWHRDIHSQNEQKQLDKPTILLPFLDPVNGKKEELKILKDKDELITQIFILRDDGNYLLTDLLTEILKAFNSNIIDFTNMPDNSKIKIITYIPEEPKLDYEDNFYFTLIGAPCNEWREELFRQALLNNENGAQKGDYDDELLAKVNKKYLWRSQLFDPLNKEWHEEWKAQIDIEGEDTWQGWNPAIYIDPSLITYWLDFIDVDQLVSNYSVNQIGRRTKTLTKTNLSLLYKLEVPDIIFFENTGEADLIQKIEQYQLEGQAYCALKPAQMKLFSSSATGSTAFDYIRDMLYQYLIYNLTVTINCTPRYYLEPNNLIYIDDKKSNIKGEFVISQYTLPLTYNGNMSITTNEALTRV